MFSPNVELQCVRLWIILILFHGFELHFIRLWSLLSYPVFLDNTSSEVGICLDLHTLFVLFLLMYLHYFYYVYCTFYVLTSLYYTLNLLKTGINEQVYMNPLMNYIYRAAAS